MSGNKNQAVVPLRLPEELLRKLIVLSKAQGRTLNNEFLLLARNAVAYHERARGKLDAGALAAVDVSAYLVDRAADGDGGENKENKENKGNHGEERE